MPLSLEPGIKYPIVLDSDADKPKESQPTFFSPSLSMRAQQSVADTLDSLTSEQTTEDIFAAHCTKLGEVIVGWKNMGQHEFGKVEFRDLLTFNEAREILRKVMYNQHVTPVEKKDSA